MPYVKRSDSGEIIAISQQRTEGFDEEVSANSAELGAFFQAMGHDDASLSATDKDFIRVLEDVVELLIGKGVILFTELPPQAQEKILLRRRLRSETTGLSNLIGED
ncbi:MAG: hypothetical protein P8M21_11060 [Halioglobus sp.]|nr:hypothetical protein [Halioglobus sp.]